jgi:hypothetical protein
MGANDQTYTLPAVVPSKIISFPTVPMEDTEAELWLAAHDRLVKAAHALDRSLLLCEIQNWKADLNSRIVKEFRATLAEVKRLESEHGGYQAQPTAETPQQAAISHLRVALSQTHPSDDQVILGHVREALALLETGGAA